MIVINFKVSELLQQSRCLSRANQCMHQRIRKSVSLVNSDRAHNRYKGMWWIFRISLFDLFPPSHYLLLRQIHVINRLFKRVYLTLNPTSYVGGEKEILLLEIVLGLLNFEGIVDHLDLNAECLLLHLEVADWQLPLGVLNHEGVAVSVEVTRQVLNAPSQCRFYSYVFLVADEALFTLDDLMSFLLKKLEDWVTLADFHECIEEQCVVILQVCTIKPDGSLDHFLHYGGFEDGKEFFAFHLYQKLHIGGCEVKCITEKLKPKLFFILVRSLGLKVILQHLVFVRFAWTELVVCHFCEENNVLSVQHWHQNVKKEFALDFTHLECFSYQENVLSDV